MSYNKDEDEDFNSLLDSLLNGEIDDETIIDDIIRCNGCKKHPNDIDEYTYLAELEGYSSNVEFVKREEGTYNRYNGHFWCTSCYIKAGMPLGVAS